MTQEIRVTLILEVDVDQDKEDIKSFVAAAIEKRCLQYFLEAKPNYKLICIDKIEEEEEIYDNQ